MMSTKPRVAVGGILHETHTFMSQTTTLADFQQQSLAVGAAITQQFAGTRSGIGGIIDFGADKWLLTPTLYAAAMPAGTVEQSAYETLATDLIERLQSALPLDGVVLVLHGAMVTETVLDVESDLVARVRAVVGDETPIVVELDMHGNISPRLVELVDALVAYNTNPHLDMYERGQDAAAIMARLLSGDIRRPTAAHASPALLLAPQATGTADLPLSAVHDHANTIRQDSDVVTVSVFGGFAYADTPFTGASVIVTTNDRPEKAQRYARQLADLMRQHRAEALPQLHTASAGVERALNMSGRPIILVDSADNIGGGTPGDGTDALVAMLAHHVQDGTIVLADPQAVAACWDAGVGADVTVNVGAKVDSWHGRPVTVSGVVSQVALGSFTCENPDNHFASFYGETVQMGRTVWLRVGGVNILLTERKTPPFDLGQLRFIGIEPEKQNLIVVKSAVAYRAAYLPIAAGVVELDTAGLCSANLTRFPYQHLTRPIYPLD